MIVSVETNAQSKNNVDKIVTYRLIINNVLCGTDVSTYQYVITLKICMIDV